MLNIYLNLRQSRWTLGGVFIHPTKPENPSNPSNPNFYFYFYQLRKRIERRELLYRIREVEKVLNGPGEFLSFSGPQRIADAEWKEVKARLRREYYQTQQVSGNNNKGRLIPTSQMSSCSQAVISCAARRRSQ
eukprot:COSAG06_NODE_1491_length_9280_cov_2.615075_9_plen_133_part_00